MAAMPTWPAAAEAARAHLAEAAQDKHRSDRFDMDDAPDLSALNADPILHKALSWLGERLTQPWADADRAAIRHRRVHQRLARIAIATGTAAIVFAVFVLATQQSWPKLTPVVLRLEAIAAVAAAVAVGFGLRAKNDRLWLGQRHRAERLRMLKFQALVRPELWAGDWTGWQIWVNDEVARIAGAHEFGRIRDWAHGGTAEVAAASVPTRAEDATGRTFLIAYYHHKRIGFQADYFREKSDEHTRQIRPFRHRSHRFFVASLVCVLLHFVTDFAAQRVLPGIAPTWIRAVEVLSIWTVAFAAVLPILGLGLRAWAGALEHVRSAALFRAKHRALTEVSQQLDQEQAELGLTCQHIANLEHFLEEEHREWLRLLLEAEWFM